jgi:hypothetical protein
MYLVLSVLNYFFLCKAVGKNYKKKLKELSDYECFYCGLKQYLLERN